MTSREFCYWLQGMFELGGPNTFDLKQTESIKRHLAMVFKHEIDPSAGTPEHQAALSKIHNPGLPEQASALLPGHLGPSSDLVLRC